MSSGTKSLSKLIKLDKFDILIHTFLLADDKRGKIGYPRNAVTHIENQTHDLLPAASRIVSSRENIRHSDVD